MYEQGKREMDYESLIKLADFYKVSVDYLLGRVSIPDFLGEYKQDELEFLSRSVLLYQDIKNKYDK